MSTSIAQPSDPAFPGSTDGGFEAASHLILTYLNAQVPMGFWSITRMENGRQTYLYLEDNAYGLARGDSHPWEHSYCVRMVGGGVPRIAPDAQAVPAYAAAEINETVPIAAYAGAPIVEPDGSLFGAICGLDPGLRPELPGFAPTLDLLAGLLTVTLSADRALRAAERSSTAAQTQAATDVLTGIANRRAWDEALTMLDRDFETYADPTVVVVIDLDGLKQVNDGPGGHAAGDRLLKRAAHVMRRQVRDADFLARLGGDEFGIILRTCPADRAPGFADRLTRALDAAGTPGSLGWAPLSLDGAGAHAAVKAADEAMYAAKSHRRAGRRAGRRAAGRVDGRVDRRVDRPAAGQGDNLRDDQRDDQGDRRAGDQDDRRAPRPASASDVDRRGST